MDRRSGLRTRLLWLGGWSDLRARLLREPDVAGEWRPDPAMLLEVDVAEASVAGVRLGDPVERLACLGAPGNRYALAKSSFQYHHLGLEADGDDHGRLDSFTVIFVAQGPMPHAPFPGALRWNGQPVPLKEPATARALLDLLGPPDDLDDADPDDVTHRYERELFDLELCTDRQGRLLDLLVMARTNTRHGAAT